MASQEQKTLMHDRVNFDDYKGDAWVLLHEGDTHLYFGIAGNGGTVTPTVTCSLKVNEAEAFIALLQRGLDVIKADIVRVAADNPSPTTPTVCPLCDSSRIRNLAFTRWFCDACSGSFPGAEPAATEDQPNT